MTNHDLTRIHTKEYGFSVRPKFLPELAVSKQVASYISTSINYQPRIRCLNLISEGEWKPEAWQKVGGEDITFPVIRSRRYVQLSYFLVERKLRKR
jgi:hypothetical protein